MIPSPHPSEKAVLGALDCQLISHESLVKMTGSYLPATNKQRTICKIK